MLRRSLNDCIAKHGVRLTFIAEKAGVVRQTASGINSGRTKRVALHTQAAILEVICRIEEGTLPVPPEARRPVGKAPVQAYGDVCGWGHERTPDNIRIVNGRRICKKCETRRRKAYELRKARGLVGA